MADYSFGNWLVPPTNSGYAVPTNSYGMPPLPMAGSYGALMPGSGMMDYLNPVPGMGSTLTPTPLMGINNTPIASAVNPLPTERSWMDRFFNTRDEQGWGGLAIGAAQGLGNLYLGMQQYGLAKDALANSRNQFERQYTAQRTLTNARLEDRQRARVASNPGYESVDSYMNRNRVV